MADLFKEQPLETSLVKNTMVDENVIAGKYDELSERPWRSRIEYLQSFPKPTRASRILATSYGASHWTHTASVQIHFPDGAENKYFLKVAAGERGLGMMEGEFESTKVIYAVAPYFAPQPIA